MSAPSYVQVRGSLFMTGEEYMCNHRRTTFLKYGIFSEIHLNKTT